MSTFKKGKVVILPTNEATGDFSKERIYPCLLKYSWMFDKEEKGKLIFTNSNIRTPTQLQNLYIISDDEIKLFDCVYNNKENIVERITSKTQLIFVLEENKENQTFKKIIATTDASLGLPQPSQQFIEEFVEEYNEGNTIEWVDVEYICVGYDTSVEGNPNIFIPKVNSKNEIFIRKIKDSWNREEVIILLEKALAESKEQYSLLDRVGINKWIEENL